MLDWLAPLEVYIKDYFIHRTAVSHYITLNNWHIAGLLTGLAKLIKFGYILRQYLKKRIKRA